MSLLPLIVFIRLKKFSLITFSTFFLLIVLNLFPLEINPILNLSLNISIIVKVFLF